MRRLTKMLLAFFTASAFLLVGGSAFGMGVVPPSEDGISFDVSGFITVAPGFYTLDSPDSAQSGDAPASLELTLESRIHFSFGTDSLKLIGSQWTRKDPNIFDVNGAAGGEGELKMVYLDWNVTDTTHIYMGRLGNQGGTWNQRTCIWETYMGWTPVLPAGCYLMHWENNDIFDITYNLNSDLQIGLYASDGGLVSSLGAGQARDVRPPGGNVGGNACSAAAGGDGCGVSTTLGPTFMVSFGRSRVSGTFQIEQQTREDTTIADSEGFDDSEDLSHTGLIVIYRNDYGDDGGVFGVQYTLLNVDGGNAGVDTTVTDIATEVTVELGDSQVAFLNFNLYSADFDGDVVDKTYIDFGWIDNGFGPGQRIGLAYRQLDTAAIDSADDSLASVIEFSVWQNF